MITPELQALIDAPLADPTRINLPEGRRPLRRGPKPTYAGDMGGDPLTSKQVRARKAKAEEMKLVAMLDHYGKTSVPFERIAKHLKLTLQQVSVAMKGRGRLS
jgi:predicted Rossmann fold nucleotide-binding protein DprA/Smf involved in DNA uptake